MKEHEDLINLINTLSQQDFERLMFTLLTNERRKVNNEDNLLNDYLTETIEKENL